MEFVKGSKYAGLQNFRSTYGRAGYSFTASRHAAKYKNKASNSLGIKRGRDALVSGPNKKLKMALGSRTRFKRKRGKSRRKYRRRQFIPRTLAPYTKMVRLNATNFIAHTAHTAGALVMTPLQLNSFDDPFTTGGIGQPLGYDQYKALYKKAFVVSSYVRVKIVNTDASYAVVVGLTPMPLSSAATSLAVYEHYMELPNTKHVVLSPDMDHGMLSNKVFTKKHMHLNKLRDVDEIRIDLVNETAPADLCYWHLWSQPINQSSDPTGDVQLIVSIWYTIVLIDPIVPSRSEET